jgi:hypothetical protein
MRLAIALMLAVLACAFTGAQAGNDKIDYYECKADNDEAASVFGVDETTGKVCDRSSQVAWITPTALDDAHVVWNDQTSTKAIYRKGKEKRYEHDVFIFVHVGHCSHLKVPPAQTCSN